MLAYSIARYTPLTVPESSGRCFRRIRDRSCILRVETLLSCDLLGKYAVHRTRKHTQCPFDRRFVGRTLVPDETNPREGNATLENRSGHPDPSTLPSHKAATQAPLELVAALPKVRAQHPPPRKP